MSVSYAPSHLSVPAGFEYVLESLAREVLREQPKDIIAFAADYFKTKLILRDQGGLTDTPLHTQPVHHIPIEQDSPSQEEQTNVTTHTSSDQPVQSEQTGTLALEPKVEDTETQSVSDVDEPGAGSQTESVDASGNEDEIIVGSTQPEGGEQDETTGNQPESGGGDVEGQSVGSVEDDTTGEASESKGQDEVPAHEDIAEGVEKSSESKDQPLNDTPQAVDVVGVAQEEDDSAEKTEERNLDGLPPESEQVRHDSEGSKVKLEDQSPAETQVTVDTINTEKEGEGADLSLPTEQEGTHNELKLSSTDLKVNDQTDEPVQSQTDELEGSQADKPEESQADKPEESQPEEDQKDKPEESQAKEDQADKPEESQVEESQADKPEESQPEEDQETKPESTTIIAEASEQDTVTPLDDNQVSTGEPEPINKDSDLPPSEDQPS